VSYFTKWCWWTSPLLRVRREFPPRCIISTLVVCSRQPPAASWFSSVTYIPKALDTFRTLRQGTDMGGRCLSGAVYTLYLELLECPDAVAPRARLAPAPSRLVCWLARAECTPAPATAQIVKLQVLRSAPHPLLGVGDRSTVHGLFAGCVKESSARTPRVARTCPIGGSPRLRGRSARGGTTPTQRSAFAAVLRGRRHNDGDSRSTEPELPPGPLERSGRVELVGNASESSAASSGSSGISGWRGMTGMKAGLPNSAGLP